MMRFEPADISADAWARAVAPFDRLSLMQCWEYGAARATDGWGVERGLFYSDGAAVGAAQAMIRPLPLVGGGLVWISRGPLFDGDSDGDLASILAALRAHYVAGRGWYLRIALPVAADNPVLGGLAQARFRLTDTPGWASATVDLGLSLDALRARLAQKWRNALNKAERSGATVTRAEGDGFDGFLTEYGAFVARRGFATTVTPALLGRLHARMADGALVCYRATRAGEALGSALIARYGHTAEYLAGTLLDAGRGINVGQLLLWRALTDAKATGARRFDVGGMDPALTPKGIYDFKAGLGGAPYRLVNEIEADGGGMRARLVRWRVTRARRVAAAP